VTAYCIRPLDRAIDTAGFRCGQPALDDYIARYASQDERRSVARVFVATPQDGERRVAGFFTLSAGSVGCQEFPAELARKLPRYPVPVALIGRLAVDLRLQGKGLGSILLADACQKVARASAVLAVAGIVVDAKDEASAAFYRHFGFIPMQGQARRLLLPAKAFCR
jgi:GNAT superfamily N-acetyltransferase